MKKILALVSAGLTLAILLTGCTSLPVTPTPATTSGPAESPTVTGTPFPSSFPTGVTWRLFSYSDGKGGMATVIGEQPVTALFRADGNVSGSSGCNQYSATYTTSGSSIKINMGISTLMACSPPIMDQEFRYFSLMANSSTYSVNGDTMLFFDSGGNAILAYKRPLEGIATPAAQSPVVGSWDLLTYNNGNNALVSVISGSSITAVFTPDGKLTGSAGCNQYSASYTLNDASLGISQISGTKKACEPDIMQQEVQYEALLKRVNKYTVNGDQLILYNALGEKILTYIKGKSVTTTVVPKTNPVVSIKTIAGTWDLKSYTDGKGGVIPVLAGTLITAKFSPEGGLSGSSGCNQYTTTYSTSGTSISISPPASTRMACEPVVMTQEAAYLSLLPKAGKFVISGDSMTLYDSSGTVLLNYKAQ